MSMNKGLLLGSLPLLLVVVGLNRHLAGAKAVGAGTLANVVAMAANGGIMPATAAALRTAGLSTDPGRFLNSTVVHHARLAWRVSTGGILDLLGALPGVLDIVFETRDAILFGLVWVFKLVRFAPRPPQRARRLHAFHRLGRDRDRL